MVKKKTTIKVILDTNVLISALLFKGQLSEIADLWKRNEITPFFSRQTFEEFTSVLKYPKFSLSAEEIEVILVDEILPYFEVVDVKEEVHGVCQDPDDDKFISCAAASSADYLVSGDAKVIEVGRYGSCIITTATEFIKIIKKTRK
ncbi:MAG: putative toxin-antitoxin system toxin component, PIN family [Deltaproteobacteria bacterium]|nr:putative toxin-antitoxin system toxin component, PIN family [Deltaproteobacteria bacterium]